VLPVCVHVCAGGFGSCSAPPTKTKKRARRCKRPVESKVEDEVVVPTKTTHREKYVAAKQRVALPMHKWKAKYWETFRKRNSYVVPVDPRWTTIQFQNEMQVRIVNELFEHHKNRYTKKWTIDLDHWRNNMEYFGEALVLYEEFDLIKLMSINWDFDVQLIHQFYATVYFGEEDDRALSLFHVP